MCGLSDDSPVRLSNPMYSEVAGREATLMLPTPPGLPQSPRFSLQLHGFELCNEMVAHELSPRSHLMGNPDWGLGALGVADWLMPRPPARLGGLQLAIRPSGLRVNDSMPCWRLGKSLGIRNHGRRSWIQKTTSFVAMPRCCRPKGCLDQTHGFVSMVCQVAGGPRLKRPRPPPAPVPHICFPPWKRHARGSSL